jgi:hypothetical protein
MRRFEFEPQEAPDLSAAESLRAIAIDLERIADELEGVDR